MSRLFDAHLHIIDPRFALVANSGYLPPPFTVDDYRARTAGFELLGGVVVSGSFQAFDQLYLIDALGRLGDGFVGVTNLPESVGDAELLELDAAGVRGVRFNLFRGGSVRVDALQRLAHRVHDLLGWHVELYLDSTALTELGALIAALPAVSIDHLGLRQAGLDDLLRLVAQGVRVKATGFGRVDFDVPPVLARIATVNPQALLFGTDLPCTRAPQPFADAHIDLLTDALGTELAEQALWRNALDFYRIGDRLGA